MVKKTGQIWLYVFMLIYSLLHIPFLLSGFGEPDAWRNGMVALHFGKGLGYAPARFPGFPVIELTYGLMAKCFSWESLWIYTNLVTLILSLVGIYFFYQIVLYHRISRPLTMVLFLYFVPIVFVNASSSMDYLWTITFILTAYWSLIKRRPIVGGIFLGMAIGTRLTTGIFGLPFLIFLIWNTEIFPPKTAFRSAVLFIFSAVIISAGWYLPLFIQYHFSFISTLFPPRDFIRSGYYILQEILGLPGTIGLLVLMVGKRKGFVKWNWELSLWSTIIIAYSALFLIKPEKVEYLIPMLPFLCLWIARWFNGISVPILASLVVFNNILSFLVVQPTPHGFQMNWTAKGITWQKYISCQNYIQDAKYLIQYPFQPNSLVIAGWRLPGIQYQLELPIHQIRKRELLSNQVIFSYGSDKLQRKKTYLVHGSSREKRINPSQSNVVIIRPPSVY